MSNISTQSLSNVCLAAIALGNMVRLLYTVSLVAALIQFSTSYQHLSRFFYSHPNIQGNVSLCFESAFLWWLVMLNNFLIYLLTIEVFFEKYPFGFFAHVDLGCVSDIFLIVILYQMCSLQISCCLCYFTRLTVSLTLQKSGSLKEFHSSPFAFVACDFFFSHIKKIIVQPKSWSFPQCFFVMTL